MPKYFFFQHILKIIKKIAKILAYFTFTQFSILILKISLILFENTTKIRWLMDFFSAYDRSVTVAFEKLPVIRECRHYLYRSNRNTFG